jgi:hypothetical protein
LVVIICLVVFKYVFFMVFIFVCCCSNIIIIVFKYVCVCFQTMFIVFKYVCVFKYCVLCLSLSVLTKFCWLWSNMSPLCSKMLLISMFSVLKHVFSCSNVFVFVLILFPDYISHYDSICYWLCSNVVLVVFEYCSVVLIFLSMVRKYFADCVTNLFRVVLMLIVGPFRR